MSLERFPSQTSLGMIQMLPLSMQTAAIDVHTYMYMFDGVNISNSIKKDEEKRRERK